MHHSRARGFATASIASAQTIGVDFNKPGGASIPNWTEMTGPDAVTRA